MGNGFEVQFQADLATPQQFINCYVACDDLAGTQRMATLKPAIASGLFPKITDMEEDRPILSRVSPYPSVEPQGRSRDPSEAFDDEIDDADLAAVAAGDDEFEDIDDVVKELPTLAGSGTSRKSAKHSERSNDKDTSLADYTPKQLPNGNWECRHPCTDKAGCRHPCCQNGLDKPPKPKKPKQVEDKVDDTPNEKDAPSKSTKTKKIPVVVHTDPFTASKKTSSAKQFKQSKSALTKRPRSNDTDFGGDDIDFDDVIADGPALTLDSFSGRSIFRPSNKANSAAKSEGLFLTSSPETSKKNQKWDEIDLSSDTPQNDGRAISATGSGKRSGITLASQLPTKKARVGPTTTGILGHKSDHLDSQRFVALSDVEYGNIDTLPRTKSSTSQRPLSRHGRTSKSPYDHDAATDMTIATAPIVHGAFTATGVAFRADANAAGTTNTDEVYDFLDMVSADDPIQMPAPLQQTPQYGIHMNPSPNTSFYAPAVHDPNDIVHTIVEDDENATCQSTSCPELETIVEVGRDQVDESNDGDDDGDDAVVVQHEEKEEEEDPEFTQWMAGLEEFIEIV